MKATRRRRRKNQPRTMIVKARGHVKAHQGVCPNCKKSLVMFCR